MKFHREEETDKSNVYQDEYLDACRQTGDIDADLFVSETFADPAQKAELYAWLKDLNNNSQLTNTPALYQNSLLFNNASRLPEWADRKLMKAGTAFFTRHAQPIMSMLGLLSLPYCYTAANGAMVLYLSERLRNDVPKRLTETAGFVWDVMAPNAFENEGKGFSSIVKVRLMHAAGRYYTHKGGQWKNDWGLPINQEDMAGTNLSFSLIVIRGLRKFGFAITYAEQQAFMHLWNVIGVLLGIQKELLPENGKQAIALEAAIRTRQFKVSDQGRALTASLTDYLLVASKNSPYSGAEVLQLMRYLLTDEVADMLGIPSPKLAESKILMLNAVNFITELKIPGISQANYIREFKNFKKQSPFVN